MARTRRNLGPAYGLAALVALGLGAAGVAKVVSGSPAGSASGAASALLDWDAATLNEPRGATLPRAQSLSDAIAQLRPSMGDTSGRLDRGSAELVRWASQHLEWRDLMALPTTNPALFRKDPDEQRGRVLCIDGKIAEIRAEKNLSQRLISDKTQSLEDQARSSGAMPGDGGVVDAGALQAAVDDDWVVPEGKAYFAIVTTETEEAKKIASKEKPLVVAAIAVRTSGSLVDGDRARFCGVLTGVNVATGPTGEVVLQHRAVGLFDLEASRAAAPASSAAPAPSAR